MNKLVWKLLRQHISIGQLSGFFLANIFGMLIVLLSVQFYKDVLPVFTQGDSFMKKDYIIATKKISTLGSITGQSNTFSKDEIKELEAQPFTRSVGAFTPTLFKVSAGLGMQQAGIRISTDMFFESVPDAFVDVSLDKWHFDEGTQTIPIIIPRNYLNLYNFGFAQSRNLPKLSEGVMGLIISASCGFAQLAEIIGRCDGTDTNGYQHAWQRTCRTIQRKYRRFLQPVEYHPCASIFYGVGKSEFRPRTGSATLPPHRGSEESHRYSHHRLLPTKEL